MRVLGGGRRPSISIGAKILPLQGMRRTMRNQAEELERTRYELAASRAGLD
jgi:hypothetical protein